MRFEKISRFGGLRLSRTRALMGALDKLIIASDGPSDSRNPRALHLRGESRLSKSPRPVIFPLEKPARHKHTRSVCTLLCVASARHNNIEISRASGILRPPAVEGYRDFDQQVTGRNLASSCHPVWSSDECVLPPRTCVETMCALARELGISLANIIFIVYSSSARNSLHFQVTLVSYAHLRRRLFRAPRQKFIY